ncbi:MAG TPA: rhomboid family intramembrane serine protease [Streptosporangiaceae bacterium]|nr:rhomboid family intramembrane serine protease [Streptosporangiaceae bacterium]
MSSSGGGTVNAVLYVIMLACTVRAGVVLLGGDLARALRRPPVAAVALWLIVAIPSLLQFAFPGLLHALERDPDQIRQHGQWWRLVTSAVVQDGGVAGTVFNLVILAIVSVVAIQAWGSLRGLIIFAAGVVGFDLATTFAWPSVGAGNSAATFTLAASVAGLAVVKVRERTVVVLGAVTAGCGIILLALRDAHGSAVVGGLVIGVLVGAVCPPGIISGSAARAARGDAR